MSEEETPTGGETGEPAPTAAPPAVSGPLPGSTEQPCPPRQQASVAWWPFLVYLTMWAALVGGTVFLLHGPEVEYIPLENPHYPLLLLLAVTLTAFGPLLATVVGVVAWVQSEPGCRSGVVIVALVRGASTTLFGVLAWWAALVLIDQIRLGVLG